MEAFSIEVAPRQERGTSASRRLRAAGFIPATVYHAGEDSHSVVVSQKEFNRLGSMARKSQVFTLKSNVEHLNDRIAIVKEVQVDYLSRKALHIDFQALKEDEEIIVKVPLKIVGESPGVKQDGGILNMLVHDLGVACLPRSIPTEIPLDISALEVGNSLHARDVPLPAGVKLHDGADETIVTVMAPQAVAEAVAATPGAEGAAAAPGAEGAAAPAATATPAAGTAKASEKK